MIRSMFFKEIIACFVLFILKKKKQDLVIQKNIQIYEKFMKIYYLHKVMEILCIF